MNKKIRVLAVIIGGVLQVVLGMTYGFSKTPVSDTGCFLIWCCCAFVIYQSVGNHETI